MTVISIPNILREKLGESGAQALLELLSKVEESAKDRTIEVLESRFEKQLAEFETRIERRLSDFKTDIIRWMIGISIAQITLILTIISVFFKR